jgi:NADPH-dependent 2,4-dienoyl-CoA reductase/sulfur reductase-like enzyme
MPYYIGDVIKDEKRLVARTPEKFRETGIDVKLKTSVTEIDPDEKVVRLSDGSILPYDILVMATGATPFLPPMPGVDLEGVFTMKWLTDAIRIKAYIKETQCRKALIVGAGFIGMEMCESLRALGIETQVVHRGTLPVNRWDPDFLKVIMEELQRNEVSFLTRVEMQSIEKGKDFRLRLNTNKGPLEADLILMALGVKPNVRLAADISLQIGKTGAIQVNFSQRTSREGIYAVGDCCEVYHRISRQWVHIPLGDIANKQGRVAGTNIGGSSMIFPGVVGAQSFRIFKLEVAATGLGEREAAASGFDPVSTIVWGNAIAGMMPGNKPVGVKLLADRSTGQLLGAQAVGEAGAVSRINTLSCALWNGMDLDEIGYLDLAYTPPFSGAWDPIHMAAQGLLRQIRGIEGG